MVAKWVFEYFQGKRPPRLEENYHRVSFRKDEWKNLNQHLGENLTSNFFRILGEKIRFSASQNIPTLDLFGILGERKITGDL